MRSDNNRHKKNDMRRWNLAEKDIAISELHENFRIHEGRLLRKTSLSPTARAGEEPKNFCSRGYLRVAFKGRNLRGHRIVFAMTHGYWPPGEIDHIDGDRGNNSPSNLREVTVEQNRWNRKTPLTNKSGVKGVRWDPAGKKWKAVIVIHGRSIHLGYHHDFELAVFIRKCADEKFFGTYNRK